VFGRKIPVMETTFLPPALTHRPDAAELEAFAQSVDRFGRTEVLGNARRWDADRALPETLITTMGEMGLFGLSFPASVGGAGAGLVELCLAIEQLAKYDQSVAITLSAGVGLGSLPIMRFGNETLREEFLPDLLTGQSIAAFGLTEPDGGSDAGATTTRARWDATADRWVLTGEKAFITNSGWTRTSVITVTARHDASGHVHGVSDGEISAFSIPTGTPGLSVGASYDKLGWHASDTHPVYLDNVAVPTTHLLGTPGAGFKQMLRTLDEGRIAISALACGVIAACLDAAIQHAQTRHAFGQPIGSFQGVSFGISDMATDLAAARALTYQAALEADAGREIRQSASMAKLFSSERAVDATRTATQVLGGLGFLEDSPIARHYRDSKILEIGEGTSEIQRVVIARTLGITG